MRNEITRQQLEDLDDARLFGRMEDFNRLLKEYTGIEARPYMAYKYFDSADNYVGDSDDDDIIEILYRADIKIRSDKND